MDSVRPEVEASAAERPARLGSRWELAAGMALLWIIPVAAFVLVLVQVGTR